MVIFTDIETTALKYGLKYEARFVADIKEFYHATNKLNANERVAVYRDVGKQVAKATGWKRNKDLERINRHRNIYTESEKGKPGAHYSLDTQHGRFVIYDRSGNYQGEIDFGGTFYDKIDKTGAHDINVN